MTRGWKMTEQLAVQSGDVLVLVGTTKGAFLFRTDPEHEKTEASGPHFPGQAIYALAYDGRAGRRRVLAGTESSHWGSVVRHSDDLGGTWTDPAEGNARCPADTGAALTRVWQLVPADDDHPEVVYAGVEPAALFRSGDGGETFELVRGLWDHPHRSKWTPGGGGLCLHTVLLDPDEPATGASGPSSCPTPTPSSDSACTRSPRRRAVRSACSCRTTGACTAATTPASTGSTSPTGCRATSASRWWRTRPTRTPPGSSR